MEKNQDFMKKYYTEEQLKAIAERGKNFNAADQVKASAEWDDIYKTAKKLADKDADPAGKEAQALAKRAQVMIDAFTGGDKGVESGLSKFYADRQNWPAQMQNFVPKLDDKTRQFYEAMMKAHKGETGREVSRTDNVCRSNQPYSIINKILYKNGKIFFKPLVNRS